ncbi:MULTISPECIES: type II toxin-antitoxin system HicA family toxin [Cysteiniphilum]|nr:MULTISPECIES: type II toxin-antitoxin system HicA family toxin [Cysteiniphilum]
MKAKHKKVLDSIFEKPVNSSIPWKDIEALMIHLGAEISEGSGSRVRIALNGVRAVFHRPHPRKETDKGAVVSVRRMLIEAGVKEHEL